MGAEQSANRDAGAGTQAPGALQKTCYYELLSVERTATDEEIKKAYRRKALELHPDRNLHDTENATRRFAEVQTAYEILSDVQERAWYDSHRDAILRGDDGTAGPDEEESRFYNNIRLTPSEEVYSLIGRFNSSIPFDDSPSGFFGIVHATFVQLALEEEAASGWDSLETPIEYPSFGKADDSFDAVAKPFYRDWSNFATRKSFSWKDKYRMSDAPERAVRRIMEKENKKARDAAIREFNDAVRSLVAFVRKRDPRYIANTQSEAERQKVLRDAAAAQAARQRAANQEKLAAAYIEPEWARSRPDGEADIHEGGFSSGAETEVVDEIECVVCDKSFKSEKQFEAHEKSKKHIKAVQQLQRQMKKENKDLHLDSERELASELKSSTAPKPAPLPKKQAEPESGDELGNELEGGELTQNGARKNEVSDEDGDDSDEEENDEYAPREVVEKRFVGSQTEQGDNSRVDGLTVELDGLDLERQAADATAKKVGKAKAKRDRKAARQAAAMAEQPEAKFVCTICSEPFSSNTKLHQHLKSKHPMTIKGANPGRKKKG